MHGKDGMEVGKELNEKVSQEIDGKGGQATSGRKIYRTNASQK